MNKIYQKMYQRKKNRSKGVLGVFAYKAVWGPLYSTSSPAVKRAGFTLIELLVVVLIIGILAAVALPQYEKAVIKARGMEGLTTMRSLAPAVEEYMLANGTMADNWDSVSLRPASGTKDSQGFISGKYFRYGFQYGIRLQCWDNKTSTWGFIWYPGENPGVDGKQFYCFVYRGSEADKKNYCALVGGTDKMDSPTSSVHDWYLLD